MWKCYATFLKKNVYAHGYSMKNKTQIIIVFVNIFCCFWFFILIKYYAYQNYFSSPNNKEMHESEKIVLKKKENIFPSWFNLLSFQWVFFFFYHSMISWKTGSKKFHEVGYQQYIILNIKIYFFNWNSVLCFW
jgi:hypothetical protein